MAPAPSIPVSVLIADADARYRSVLCELLENEGFGVLAAADDETAYRAAVAHRPQVIAVDLGLPTAGGQRLIRRLRQVPALAAARVIALCPDGDDGPECTAPEADAWAAKEDFEALWQRLYGVLDPGGVRRHGTPSREPKRHLFLSPATVASLLRGGAHDAAGSNVAGGSRREVETRLREKIRSLEFLRDLSELARSNQPEEVIFSSLLEKSVDSLHAEAGTIALCDFGASAPPDLVFLYTCGERAAALRGMRLKGDTGVVGWVVANDRPALVNDVDHDPRFYRSVDQAHDFTTRSLLCAPLKSGDRTIGAIEIVNRREGLFDRDDLTLLTTIVNMTAQLIQQVQDEAALRANEKQLAHAQRMESVGTLASGVAHNFRNLLFGIQGNSQLIEMKCRDQPEIRCHAERISRIVGQGTELVQALMQLARNDGEDLRVPLDLAEVIREAAAIIRESISKRIAVRTDLPVPLPVVGDATALTQVFLNLATNARDAIDGFGELVIAGRRGRGRVSVSVSDSGCGMDDTTQARIFDPFFTTKGEGRGTGLGLSTVFGCVRKHGGVIRVSSAPGRGTTFLIELPEDASMRPAAPVEPMPAVNGGGRKILVVDDGQAVLEPIREALERLDYRTRSAAGVRQAADAYGEWRPDAVLLEHQPAGLEAAACIKHLLAVDPQARIVLVSGYDPDGPDGVDPDVARRIRGYMVKPFEIGSLSRLLRDIT